MQAIVILAVVEEDELIFRRERVAAVLASNGDYEVCELDLVSIGTVENRVSGEIVRRAVGHSGKRVAQRPWTCLEGNEDYPSLRYAADDLEVRHHCLVEFPRVCVVERSCQCIV